MRRKVSDKVIEQALVANAGICRQAAIWIEERTGVSYTRQSLIERVERNPRLQRALHRTIEEILDLCDGQLLQLINQGNLGAIIWYQRNRGKHRGWGLRDYDAEDRDLSRVVGVDEPALDAALDKLSNQELLVLEGAYRKLSERPLDAPRNDTAVSDPAGPAT